MTTDHKRSAYTQDLGGYDLAARIHECQAAMHASADELAGRPPSAKRKKHTAKARLLRRSAWQARRRKNMRRRPAPVEPLLYSARTSARAGEAGSPGAKRAAGIRSGTDPGDPDSPEPPPRRRKICKTPGCGLEVGPDRASQAQTCTKKCAERGKKRKQRAAKRAAKLTAPDRAPLVDVPSIRYRGKGGHAAVVGESSRSGLVEDGVDRHRAEPYLEFDLVPVEALRLRQGCRCNGHHIADEYGDGCVKCGHWLPKSHLEELAA